MPVNEALIYRAADPSSGWVHRGVVDFHDPIGLIMINDTASLKSVYNSLWGFRGNEAFFKRIKRFMVGYGFLYTAFIFLSIIFGSAEAHSSIYLLFLASIVTTTFLILIPPEWLSKLLPFFIAIYIVFIHGLLTYTGGSASPYAPLYFLPIILASLLFGYAGAAVSIVLTFASYAIMELYEFGEVSLNMFYQYFLMADMPFFIIAALLSLIAVFVAGMLKDEMENVTGIKNELEGIFDTVTDAISIHDTDYNIVRVNKYAAERLGEPPERLIGRKCYEVFHGANEPVKDCPNRKTLEDKKAHTSEISEPRLSGIFEISTYPLFKEGDMLIGTVHHMKDITARRLAEDSLRKELAVTNVLHRTDVAILSTSDRAEILNICLTNVSALVKVEYASIATIDKEKTVFVVEARRFFDKVSGKDVAVPFDSTILKTAVFSGHSIYYPELKESDLLAGDKGILASGVKSLFVIPLIEKGAASGALTLGSFKENGFAAEERAALERYALQVALALDRTNLTERIREMFLNTIISLSAMLEAKSPWTMNHSEGVARYSTAIALELGLDKVMMEELTLAVLLHDIGKIGISDDILNKPGVLSKDETALMMEHPVKGASIIEPVKEFKNIIPVVRHHHEWWNGSGYPDGLSGNMIPLAARIINAADAFEAMTTDRPYKKRRTMIEAKEEMRRCAGVQFDPDVAAALIRALRQ
ncbi:MAG: HD domain-containing phosphohydrolase [Thermodesulfobacteriota bacterium]